MKRPCFRFCHFLVDCRIEKWTHFGTAAINCAQEDTGHDNYWSKYQSNKLGTICGPLISHCNSFISIQALKSSFKGFITHLIPRCGTRSNGWCLGQVINGSGPGAIIFLSLGLKLGLWECDFDLNLIFFSLWLSAVTLVQTASFDKPTGSNGVY